MALYRSRLSENFPDGFKIVLILPDDLEIFHTVSKLLEYFHKVSKDFGRLQNFTDLSEYKHLKGRLDPPLVTNSVCNKKNAKN